MAASPSKSRYNGLRGVSPKLEVAFDTIHAQGTALFGFSQAPGSEVSTRAPSNSNKGHTFIVEDGVVVADYYHFGADVDYEFAVQIRFGPDAQERLADLLVLAQPVSPDALAEALRDRFGSYYATRDFADENGISYEALRDMWP